MRRTSTDDVKSELQPHHLVAGPDHGRRKSNRHGQVRWNDHFVLICVLMSKLEKKPIIVDELEMVESRWVPRPIYFCYLQEVSNICRKQIGGISKSCRLALVSLEGVAQCLCGDSDLPADMIPSSRGYFPPKGSRYFWQAPITICHSETGAGSEDRTHLQGADDYEAAGHWLILVTSVVTSLVTMGSDWAMGGASFLSETLSWNSCWCFR